MSAQIGYFPLEILMSPYCHLVFESGSHWSLHPSPRSNCKWIIVHMFVPLYAIHKNHIDIKARRMKEWRKRKKGGLWPKEELKFSSHSVKLQHNIRKINSQPAMLYIHHMSLRPLNLHLCVLNREIKNSKRLKLCIR